MRVAILLCLTLMSCSEEPTFDEQFEKQAAEIEAKAEKIERDVKAQIELVPEAAEAEKAETPTDGADE